MLLALAGCNTTKEGSRTESGTMEIMETAEQGEKVQDVSGQTAETEKVAEGIEEAASVTDKDTVGAALADSDKENQPETASKEEKTEPDSFKDDSKNEKETQLSALTENKKEEKSSEKKDDATETKKEQDTVTEAKAVSYSPDTVVALAIAKCQAGGMITTQDNLANALSEGRITQEEYNEYYPYDGLEGSYYSVFVETDLNKASTTSGQPLRSQDAIAGYIADMLLLESSPVFNVVYAGTYSKNGTSFYEFRCLR